MTLLDILLEVQEGINKLPPLTDYLDAATEFSFDRYWKTITNSQSDADEIYKTAFGAVVELIKVMQLADADIEPATAIDNLRKCDNCALASVCEYDEDHEPNCHGVVQRASDNIKKTAAIEELTHHIGKHPIAVLRIRNRRPVFAYAERREQTKPNPQESDYLSEVIKIVNELAKINDLRMIRR